MKFVYPAVIRKKEDGFHVTFPDLDGCHAEGRSLDDAIENAKDAEINWIMLELEEGGDIPARTALEDIPKEEGALVQYVSASVRFFEGYDE